MVYKRNMRFASKNQRATKTKAQKWKLFLNETLVHPPDVEMVNVAPTSYE